MRNKNIFIKIIFVFIFIVSIALAEKAHAQNDKDLKKNLKIPDSKNIQIITLTDGSGIMGRIIEVKENEIQFQADVGTLTISIAKIKDIKEIPESLIKKGVYWFPNPNATRLYFSPTAYMLKRGEGYIADYYLFFPMVSFGITDNISIGGGISIFPGANIDKQIFYFTPKIGLKATENFHLAAGALLVKIPGFFNDESNTVGILYGLGTLGTPDLNFSAGLGYGFTGSDLAEKPMVMIGFQARFARRASFVSENWIFPGVDQPLVSYGIRLFGEKMSVDLAFINTLAGGIGFPGVPYVDFVFKF
jgi:preprotein translocase subunit YajC